MSSPAANLAGTPAAETPLRVGNATIAPATGSIAVADTAITLNSIVVCWGLGPIDNTATSFSVDNLAAGVGFSIVCDANATAAKQVGYAVLRY
jgi:hypothetical protein